MAPSQIPLYVRLAPDPSRRLDRAAEVSGKSKRQIVEDAVREHLDDRGFEVGRAVLRQELPEVLTLEEAAALLRVEATALEVAAAAGEVPSRRIDGQWRFTRTALLGWLGQGADGTR